MLGPVAGTDGGLNGAGARTDDHRASKVELRDDHVLVHELRVGGPAYEAARQATEQDRDLETVVRGMLDIGGTVLLRRTSQAVIDSFQAEIRGAVNLATERITGARAVRAERDRGTEKGLSYEAMIAEVAAWVCGEDAVEFTGNTWGEDGNKKGDVLVRPTRAATRGHDLRIVLEAKDQPKTEHAMLAELDQAIRNRGADAGIFVFAKRQQAPLDGRALGAYPGNRFAIVYDKDDRDPLALEVVCEMGRRALVAKVNRQASSIDPEQLADGLERLSDIIDNATAIATGLKSARRGLDKIEDGYEQVCRDARALICELEHELLP